MSAPVRRPSKEGGAAAARFYGIFHKKDPCFFLIQLLFSCIQVL